MLSDVTHMLRCPACAAPVSLAAGALGCERGHRFDVARQGYVNLLAGDARPTTADTPAMVAARVALLESGVMAAVAEALAARLAWVTVRGVCGGIVEIGAGTAYYLSACLRARRDRAGLALDISAHAARRAARQPGRIGAAVCDAWGSLPVADDRAAVVLGVFAPRNTSESARILAPGGRLVLVTPTPAHLAEVVEAVGLISVDPEKGERLDRSIQGTFELECRERVEYPVTLSRDQVRAVAQMGPSAHHLTAEAIEERVGRLPSTTETSVAVDISVFRPLGARL